MTDRNVTPMRGLVNTGLWPWAWRPVSPTRVLDAIQGHAPRTAAEGYGEVTIATISAAIKPRLEVIA